MKEEMMKKVEKLRSMGEKRAHEYLEACEKVAKMQPKEIYEEIGKQVYGQEETKKSLSVILYQHLKRLELPKEGMPVKTNAILIGPTGCGKTLVAKAIAGLAGLPFIKVDAQNLVQRGYRGGMHIEQITNLLLTAAKGNRWLAKHGIVFIDELDKLAYWGDYSGDISTLGVQQDLLTMIDGGEVFYEPDSTEYSREKFDFCDVLFIFGGAFSTIQDKKKIARNDLVQYGLMPEFANRLGNIIRMDNISEEVIKHLVEKQVRDYKCYVPMGKLDIRVYSKVIYSSIISSRAHIAMGGRCVAPIIRRFFEDKIFNQLREVKNGKTTI